MAGLGRTGTFISLLQAVITLRVKNRLLIESGEELTNEKIMMCPFSIVRKLRE